MTLIGEKRLDKTIFNPKDLNRLNYLKHKFQRGSLKYYSLSFLFWLPSLPRVLPCNIYEIENVFVDKVIDMVMSEFATFHSNLKFNLKN